MADVILLAGNPNAGKSTLFNRLTHGHARVGNWHGVTVDALAGKTEIGGRETVLVDLPGIYDVGGQSMEEKFACRYIRERPSAALLFVAEYATLPRALGLVYALAKERRCLLVLTKRRRFFREGGRIDLAALSLALGIPAIDAQDKNLKEILAETVNGASMSARECDISAFYTPPRAGLSRADALILNPFFGLPLFLFLIGLAFFLTFARGVFGDVMKRGIERLFSEVLAGYARRIPSPVARSLVADGILKSLGSVLSFLPQIMLLHLFLVLLEESGLISRLAYLSDGFFSRLGLSGRAVFSLLMGFGCTAAAIISTRGLDDKRMQRRVIRLLPYLSCSAKLPVYLVLSASFFPDPFAAAALLYLLGAGIAVLLAFLTRGERRPLVMELAPLQIPQPFFVLKSLLFQAKQFIIKVATVILAFLLFSWLLSSFDLSFRLAEPENSILAHVCGKLGFLFAPAGMNDWRVTYAALSGLVAKENVAAALAMFYGGFPYGAASAFAFSVFILTCSPCVSAIAASGREIGRLAALGDALLQTASALIFCYLTYALCRGGWVYVLPALAPVAALAILGKSLEKIHRHNRNRPQRVHRRRLRAGVALSSRPSEKAGGTRQRRQDGGERPLESGR